MLTPEELQDEQLKKTIEGFRVLDYTKEDIRKVLRLDEATLTQICKHYDILA